MTVTETPCIEAMRDCLVRLRERARAVGREQDVAEIDAALSADPVREIIGSATVTPRQLECLRLIYEYRQANGMSPTLQEIADIMGVSKVTTFEHVCRLEEKRLLKRTERNAARSLVIVGMK